MIDKNNPYAPPTFIPDRVRVDWFSATDLRVVRVMLYVHALTVAFGWILRMSSVRDLEHGPLIFLIALLSPVGMLFAAMRLEDRPIFLRLTVVLASLTLSVLQLLCAAFR